MYHDSIVPPDPFRDDAERAVPPGRFPAFGPRPAPIAGWYDGEGPYAGLAGGPVTAAYPALVPHLVAADALAFARRQRFRSRR